MAVLRKFGCGERGNRDSDTYDDPSKAVLHATDEEVACCKGKSMK